jgi:hypothetical protein
MWKNSVLGKINEKTLLEPAGLISTRCERRYRRRPPGRSIHRITAYMCSPQAYWAIGLGIAGNLETGSDGVLTFPSVAKSTSSWSVSAPLENLRGGEAPESGIGW